MIFGLVLSIALMGLAASYIARLLQRYRWIAYVGLLIILYVALKMIYQGGARGRAGRRGDGSLTGSLHPRGLPRDPARRDGLPPAKRLTLETKGAHSLSTPMSAPQISFTRAGFLQGARSTFPACPGLMVFAHGLRRGRGAEGLLLRRGPWHERLRLCGRRADGRPRNLAEGLDPRHHPDDHDRHGRGQFAHDPSRRHAPALAPQRAHRRVRPQSLPADGCRLDFQHALPQRRRSGRGVPVRRRRRPCGCLWVADEPPGYLCRRLRPGAETLRPRPRHADLLRRHAGPALERGRPALPWLVAGLVSLVVHALVPGYVFIIAGALAGVATGMLLE